MKRPTRTEPARAFLNDYKFHGAGYIHGAMIMGCLSGGMIVVASWVMALITNAIIFEGASPADVVGLVLCLVALFVARSILSCVGDNMAFAGAARIKSAVRGDILSQITRFNPLRHGVEQGGAVINSYIDGVEALQGYYMYTLPARVVAVFIPAVIFVIVLSSDIVSGLILMVTSPLIPVFMIWIGQNADRMNQRQWRQMARLSGRLLDSLKGLQTLKIFNASQREAAVIRRMGEQFRIDTMAVLRVAFISSLAMEFFATVSIALIAVLIGFRLLWGEMSFLEGFFVLLLAPEFYGPLRRMGAHYHAKMEAIGAAEKIVALLDRPVLKAEDGIRATLAAGSVGIEFRGVTFSYPDGKNILQGASFKIDPGEKVALAGPSGGGKSTILLLILGFLQPQDGDVFINGISLSRIDSDSWHRHLSWMGQRPSLFAGKVSENVRMGREMATDEDVKNILSFCGMPGFHAVALGENGARLSGGQIQRVALARALIRRAPLLLLDEPTAHLDIETENIVQRAIKEHAEAATIIYAAHKPAALAAAGRILYVGNGCVSSKKTQRAA